MRCFFIEPTKALLLTIISRSLTDNVIFNLTVFSLIRLTLLLGLNLSINLLNNNK